MLPALVVSTAGYVAYLALRNYRIYRKFKQLVDLPIDEEWTLLGGHANRIFYHPRGWKIFDDIQKKYGKMVGFFYRDRPGLSTTDLDFIKKIVTDNPDAHPNRMTPNIFTPSLEADNIIFAEDDQWRRLRKAIAPALSVYKVKSPNVQAEIRDIIDKFTNSIEWRLDRAEQERGDKFVVVDVDDLSHRYALALIFSCFFKKPDLIDFYGEKDRWVTTTQKMIDNSINIVFRLTLLFPIIMSLVETFIEYTAFGKAMLELQKFVKEQTKHYLDAKEQLEMARKQDTTGNFDPDNFKLKDGTRFKRNIIDHVIEQFTNGTINEREYLNSMTALFMAANLTSADALSKIFYHLASHQEVQDKLRESILKDGIKSTYLTWVLHESLRLFPPTLIGCSRSLSSDVKYGKTTIPKRTWIATSAFSINRLPEYWGQDADEFKPERWANEEKFHPLQYLTFGAGKRVCPGKEFALREMHMLFDTLLRRFKFELSDREVDPMAFSAPLYIAMVNDSPTWIKVKRLEEAHNVK